MERSFMLLVIQLVMTSFFLPGFILIYILRRLKTYSPYSLSLFSTHLKYALQAHKIARCTGISAPSSSKMVASHSWLFSFSSNRACMACIDIHLPEPIFNGFVITGFDSPISLFSARLSGSVVGESLGHK